MRNAITTCIILLGTILSCSIQRAENTHSSQLFNREARESYMKVYLNKEFFPLNVKEKCILDETVTNDLERLNSLTRTEFMDSLEVRNFYDHFIGWPFSFIRNNSDGRMYFVFFADLPHFIYTLDEHYSKVTDSTYALKNPLQAVRMNCGDCIDLFSHPMFIIKSDQEKEFFAKVQLGHSLLKELDQGLYFRKVDNVTVQDYLKKALDDGLMVGKDYNLLNALLNGSFGRRESTCFLVEGVGYVIYTFSHDERNEGIKFDPYFLPFINRTLITRSVAPRHIKCFQ
jgi:hypothetical protein